ncbi:MAG: hypothetical protein HY391_03355 [Deltaproteobacteria bacterium]|nr:hypothetical protein [Deltaproteobacteria bacterium]
MRFYFLFSDEKRALGEVSALLADQWMKLRFAPGTTERKIEELLVNELKSLKRGSD